MPVNYENLKPGDFVEYSDMANLPRLYVIVETPTNGVDFRMVRVDDGSLIVNRSDCRQAGWRKVEV